MEHIILTEDVVQHNGRSLNEFYNPVHLLQLAHNATLQMSIEIKLRKREWETMKEEAQKEGSSEFVVCTPWCSPNDCMNYIRATICYTPINPTSPDYVFSIVEDMLAIDLAGTHNVSSPLFHCATEEELIAYLEERETPFKRYLHLEHIMKRLRESDAGQDTIRKLQMEEEKKEQQDIAFQFDRKPTSPKELFFHLTQYEFTKHPYELRDHGDGVYVLHQSINGWWKPRFIVDNANGRAYEFMNGGQSLVTVSDNDIDWDSLCGLPEKAVKRAKAHSGHFPTLIGGFNNGIADVKWQINPDGRYYMDDDGFGMTDDEEITLLGKIDRTGRVVTPFSYRR